VTAINIEIGLEMVENENVRSVVGVRYILKGNKWNYYFEEMREETHTHTHNELTPGIYSERNERTKDLIEEKKKENSKRNKNDEEEEEPLKIK
jgi:hypothetical protein